MKKNKEIELNFCFEIVDTAFVCVFALNVIKKIYVSDRKTNFLADLIKRIQFFCRRWWCWWWWPKTPFNGHSSQLVHMKILSLHTKSLRFSYLLLRKKLHRTFVLSLHLNIFNPSFVAVLSQNQVMRFLCKAAKEMNIIIIIIKITHTKKQFIFLYCLWNEAELKWTLNTEQWTQTSRAQIRL